jgi:hypothetical protein
MKVAVVTKDLWDSNPTYVREALIEYEGFDFSLTCFFGLIKNHISGDKFIVMQSHEDKKRLLLDSDIDKYRTMKTYLEWLEMLNIKVDKEGSFIF